MRALWPRSEWSRALPVVLGFAVIACGGGPPERELSVRRVDDARLRAAMDEPESWLTHGGNYAEQRYSPLDRVDAENVARLGLAWSFDTGTRRGLEATPIVVDGTLYTTGSWSKVFALDARTGNLRWAWDPQVASSVGPRACCDVVNRGVAVYRGRVYVGVLDGRLAALDATTGEVVWEVQTTDPERPYTITGAPRVVKGKVIIGNGGAEYGVRGYVSAYDARTGKLAWRFYTVPGDPAEGFESPALERAAETWKGGEWWKIGGGGTVWDSLAYDPELDLLYVGTGNGSPWNKFVRSPGGGDNLYLASILALRPDTGEFVWHFQTTPGDAFDYTATQHMILADLEIDGAVRKVLMQAPKNGFFYVLDRETGEFLSGDAYVEVTWAKGVDPKTGRPIPDPEADYRRESRTIYPSTLGGHNWHPMSFNPQTGLVYIPAQEIPTIFGMDPDWRYRPGEWNTAVDMTLTVEIPRELVSGHLLAWDPRKRREAWRVEHASAWNGGTLTTAGNLVFQGTSSGRFAAYRADTGTPLWETTVGTGVIAAPVTYAIDGIQYVAVMAGWGGAFALGGGDAAASLGVGRGGHLLVFRLDGDAALPDPPPPRPTRPEDEPPLQMDASNQTLAMGEALFAKNCMVCHGAGAVGAGVLPDLRHSPREVHENFDAIVLLGAREGQAMPSFAGRLTDAEVSAIQAYVLDLAAQEFAARSDSP